MLSCIGNLIGLKKKEEPKINASVVRGHWGENVACKFLAANGWQIIERNAKPSRQDLRREIDIVAFDKKNNMIAFIEVKAHKKRSPYASRLWSIDRRKKRVLLSAFRAWLAYHRWHGNYRFDVIEVYGETDAIPEIDHIIDVPIFPSSERFRR